MAESNRHGDDTRVTRKPGSFAPVPEAALQPSTDSKLVWVVDWDIPSADKAARQRFYRRLRILWRAYHGDTQMSTMSVLITAEKALALQVYHLARMFGLANLYEAIPLNP